MVNIALGGVCAANKIPMTIKYRAIGSALDFTYTITTEINQESGVVNIFTPIYELRGENAQIYFVPDSVEVPFDAKNCVQNVSLVKLGSNSRLRFTLIVPGSIENIKSYQTLRDI
jgi:hypothetical protein